MAFKPNFEQISNGAISNLDAAIDASTTSLDVVSALDFPTVGNFPIIVGSEIMLVTAVSGNTFTVTRGTEGSTAAAHNQNARVRGVLTTRSVSQLIEDKIPLAATSAGLPLYRMTSSAGASLNSSSFTWVNQGTATVSNLPFGGLSFTIPRSAGIDVRGMVRTAPSTPYTITAMVTHTAGLVRATANDFPWIGIGFRESATSKFTPIRQWPEPAVSVLNYTNETTTSTVVYESIVAYEPTRQYLQIEDDGTNLYWRRSNNGIHWIELATALRGAHFTTAPDQVGVFIHGRWGTATGSNTNHVGNLLHWSET